MQILITEGGKTRKDVEDCNFDEIFKEGLKFRRWQDDKAAGKEIEEFIWLLKSLAGASDFCLFRIMHMGIINIQ